MNRQQRRAADARMKMQNNAAKVRSALVTREEVIQVQNEAIDNLERFRMLFFALARKYGRIVVRNEDIEALGENDRIVFTKRENGDVVAEFRSDGPSA